MKKILLLLSLALPLLAIALIGLNQRPVEPVSWATFPGSAATPYTTEAVFQTFEHGVMIWRSDENCVYVLQGNSTNEDLWNAVIPSDIPETGNIHSYGYCLRVDPLSEKTVVASPPQDRSIPQGVLGRVWAYYAEVQTKLGYATSPEQAYTATVPTNQGQAAMDGSPFYWRQMTLPDGAVLQCGSRAATSGTCSLRLSR